MKKYKIGITFGAFDPVHYGHIALFERAKKRCEKLIVCVSSKKYIEKNKNRKERFSLRNRIKSLESIKFVDEVDIQKKTKKELIEKFKPDVIFVGSDWNKETFRGEGLGVKVIYLKRTEGISSSDLTKN